MLTPTLLSIAYVLLGILTLIHLASKDRVENVVQLFAVIYAWPLCWVFEIINWIKERK